MDKIICKDCGAVLDTVHEDTHEYGVYEYNEETKQYEHVSDEHPDFSEFYCPYCHAPVIDVVN